MKICRILFTVLICMLYLTLFANLQIQAKETKVSKDKFNGAIEMLSEHILLLQVDYTDPITNKPVNKTINNYDDMQIFIKLKVPGKFTLLNQKSGKILPVCEITASDMESKSLGQWFWKKVCDAAEAGGIMKDCNGFFNWK